jgi:hypothetical protein
LFVIKNGDSGLTVNYYPGEWNENNPCVVLSEREIGDWSICIVSITDFHHLEKLDLGNGSGMDGHVVA